MEKSQDGYLGGFQVGINWGGQHQHLPREGLHLGGSALRHDEVGDRLLRQLLSCSDCIGSQLSSELLSSRERLFGRLRLFVRLRFWRGPYSIPLILVEGVADPGCGERLPPRLPIRILALYREKLQVDECFAHRLRRIRCVSECDAERGAYHVSRQIRLLAEPEFVFQLPGLGMGVLAL